MPNVKTYKFSLYRNSYLYSRSDNLAALIKVAQIQWNADDRNAAWAVFCEITGEQVVRFRARQDWEIGS